MVHFNILCLDVNYIQKYYRDFLYCFDFRFANLIFFVLVIKTGESGMIVFRLLTKDNRWTWVQSNARLVYKNGRPDYIIATQRPLT